MSKNYVFVMEPELEERWKKYGNEKYTIKCSCGHKFTAWKAEANAECEKCHKIHPDYK